jgi:hypothetical protein
VTPAPVMGSTGTALYEANEPLAYADEENGFALAIMLNAIGLMWDSVADLSEPDDGTPGWSPLVDVERTPAWALPWTAQRAGITVTRGAPEDFQREELRRRSGEATGRPATMIAKVKSTLTGDKVVRLVERSSSAWRFLIVTRTAETPDAAATFAVILSEKPGGDIAEHIISDAPLIDEGTLTIDAASGTIDAATLGDIT